MPNLTTAEIEIRVAAALRCGLRVKSTSRDGQSLMAELLPRSRDVPPCFLLRLGTNRLMQREVFYAAEQAAARVLALSSPTLILAALAGLAAS